MCAPVSVCMHVYSIGLKDEKKGQGYNLLVLRTLIPVSPKSHDLPYGTQATPEGSPYQPLFLLYSKQG